MGHRTHLGIQTDGNLVEYVYSHWDAPLYCAGSAILLGELDTEQYEYQGVMKLSDFQPDLDIECAYLLTQGGNWEFCKTGERWTPLKRESVDLSYKSVLNCYKNIATGKHRRSDGFIESARPDYWRFYDRVQIEHSKFMQSELTPLTSFAALKIVQEVGDLKQRISHLASMSVEIALLAEKHCDDTCEQVEAMESEYQALFADTVKRFGEKE